MTITPHEDRVALRLEEPEKISPGGLIIPDHAAERPTIGVVIAVGPGRVGPDLQRIPMEVSPGDRVVIGPYAGAEVEVSGEPIVIVRHEEVLAVIE